MKAILSAVAVLALSIAFACVGQPAFAACNTANCLNGGSGQSTEWDVGAGSNAGSLQIGANGVLNVQTGGKLEFNGVDVTADLAAGVPNPVNGAAGGYKIASGETALGGTNPTTVTTGLSTLASCVLTIKESATPGVGTTVVTYTTSAGTLSMYGWKVTNSSTTTLIASTGTETIGWECRGT